MFLQIDEKVSKVLKFVQLRKYVKVMDELCIIKPLCSNHECIMYNKTIMLKQ